MKLGLVRHYKVITNGKYILTSKEFEQVMFNYDVAPVRKNGLKINSDDWDICYCSTLPRAITTAESIYDKEIIKTDLLVEVPIRSFAWFFTRGSYIHLYKQKKYSLHLVQKKFYK